MRRRQLLTTISTLAAAAAVTPLLVPSTAQAGSPDVDIEIEHPYGGDFPTFWHAGSMYVAGDVGERYNLRVRNNSSRRVEVVVTVDGRDVITGKLGNFKSQRGYVIDPWGSVVIDGFRQSDTHVAAFRFSEKYEAYSSRMGTPQHTGVIGVAVFEEKPRPRPKRRPYKKKRRTPPPPPRYYEPYYDPEPYPGGDSDYGARTEGRSSSKNKSGGAGGIGTAPPASAEDSTRGGSYTRRPRRDRELGTEYGESKYSAVREVTFVRRNKRKPDTMLTVYYDSMDGLRDKGVPVDPPEPYDYDYGYDYPYVRDPQPWPDTPPRRRREYAPPPPPRRY